MSTVSCPSCGHTFSPSTPTSTDPDRSVVEWFRTDHSWTGEAPTEEVYGAYLRATDGVPVSRARFVTDLAHLGIEEVLDDETLVLLRR